MHSRNSPQSSSSCPLRDTLRRIPQTAVGLVIFGIGVALLIVAESGDEWFRPGVERRREHHGNLRVEHLPGGHHIHLEDTVSDVAAMVRGFLGLGMSVRAGI